MTLIERKRKYAQKDRHRRKIKVDGSDVEVIHTCYEIGFQAYDKFNRKMHDMFGTSYKKSYVLRVLVNAYNYDLIDLEEIRDKLYEIAKDPKEDIYL